MMERKFQVVGRQTQVVERRSGPFRLNVSYLELEQMVATCIQLKISVHSTFQSACPIDCLSCDINSVAWVMRQLHDGSSGSYLHLAIQHQLCFFHVLSKFDVR